MIQLRPPIILLLLTAVTGLAYVNCFTAGFVGDDLAVIPNNARNFDNVSMISSYFSNGVWNHTNISFEDHHLYRPLWLFWTFLVYQIAEESTLIWHISNLLLHITNAYLVFILIKSFYRSHSDFTATAGALMFLVHPIAAQNAAWVSGSTDLVLTTFCLGALIFYMKQREGNQNGYLLLSIICTFGAVLTKEGGLILIPLFALIDLNFKTPLRAAIKSYAFLTIIVCSYFVLRIQALGFATGQASKWVLTPDSFSRAFEYGTVYVRSLFFPWPLPITVKHPPAGVSTFADPFLGIVLLLSLLYMAFRFPRLRFAIALIFLPMAIPLLLALNELGLFATRFLYISIIGVVLLSAPLIEEHYQKITARTAFALIMVSMISLTIMETATWKTQGTFSQKLITHNSQNPDNWVALANYQKNQGELSDVIATYQKAEVEIISRENKAKVISSSGRFYAEIGKNEASIEEFRKLLADPDNSHLGFTGIANNHWVMGNIDEALTSYQKALRAKPDHFYALYNLGQLNAQLGRYQEAVDSYEKIRLLPYSREVKAERAQAEYLLLKWRAMIQKE